MTNQEKAKKWWRLFDNEAKQIITNQYGYFTTEVIVDDITYIWECENCEVYEEAWEEYDKEISDDMKAKIYKND
jgi:hypothetical protein